MTARLTVVLDDESLYRDAKIRAAREGVPLKDVIERALSQFLHGPGRGAPPIGEEKHFDPERFSMWLKLADELDADLGAAPTERSGPRRPRMAAEERQPYDA